MINRVEVENLIIDSFQSLQYPGDLNIVYNNGSNDLDCVEVRQAFQGKNWSEVPSEVLLHENTSLYLMTAEAFRFYLPAYLLFVIQDFDRADILPETTVHCLTLPLEVDDLVRVEFFHARPHLISAELKKFLVEELGRSNQKIHQFMDRMSNLSREQGKAIKYYLEYLSKHHEDYFLSREPEIAIERYWFIF